MTILTGLKRFGAGMIVISSLAVAGHSAVAQELSEDHIAAARTAIAALGSTDQFDAIQAMVDHAFVSFRIGLVKPDRDIFDHVASDLAVDPASVVFFDDNQVNVDGARRAGFEAHASQRQLQLPTGELNDPGILFEQHFAAAILRFAANFRPGWMSHGDVWPTYLMGTDDNQDLTPYVESIRSVFEPILEHVPHVAARLGNTIAAERLVGGYVPPDKVLDFRLFLDEHAECFSQKESQFDYKKILEAVNDAEREYMGFVEASTIYSASDGILN